MELKEYQQKALSHVKNYLQLLGEWREKTRELPEVDFAEVAWQKTEVGREFHSRKNGLGEYLPSFTIKIPTGGGKTFLAVKTIDLINDIYLRKQTGLVVWIVPTTQIYNQTIKSLRDKDHPYRQHLDIASGGRTLIKEKTDKFTPTDIKENLVVLMLMLPAASRSKKEQLRMFRDNGKFQSFFPYEDDIEGQEKFLKVFPNLHTYQDLEGFWGRQIITSLGNTIAVLKPIIILDESHKGKSPIAQDTLKNLNPSIVVELSATPHSESNVLVDIKGIELDREEMIKLDLHIYNRADVDWKETLLESINHREFLEKEADDYQANTDNYIRPICLIQVERTGRDQRGSRYIHADDVREHLIKIGIPESQIAIKTSQKDELKEIDDADGLMSRNTEIRFIITKQALQEGWDCPFVYVLTILTNPQSKTALTQLVGRILRQPYARKTGTTSLDESYVFTYRQNAANILADIKQGFEGEGLGDLTTRITTEEGFEKEQQIEEKMYTVRQKFQKAAKHTILPVFAINKKSGWVQVNYDNDIAVGIDWEKVNLKIVYELKLSVKEEKDYEIVTKLSEDVEELIEYESRESDKRGGIKVDVVFVTRHLLDIVPNPWIAHEFAESILEKLTKKYGKKLVASNFVFIIEELRKHLQNEKDRLAKENFEVLLRKDILRFLIISNKIGFKLPKKRKVKTGSQTLTQTNRQPLQKSLFDFIPEEEFNEEEKRVAWYLEGQDKLLFWFRNIERKDFSIQGWRKHKIYPDFIFTGADEKAIDGFDEVFVLETKGLHLKNEDTDYKKSVLSLCSQLAKKEKYGQLEFLKDKKYRFELLHEDEWENRLNEVVGQKGHD